MSDTQLSLFDMDDASRHAAHLSHLKKVCRPAHNGDENSIAAADSIAHVAPSLRQKVLNAIIDSVDGMTCDEVELKLDMSHQTASARLRELSLNNDVIRDGKRPTRSGRSAWVYKVLI